MLKPFETSTHAKRTYRELKLLTHLNHPAAEVCIEFNSLSHHILVLINYRLFNCMMCSHQINLFKRSKIC